MKRFIMRLKTIGITFAMSFCKGVWTKKGTLTADLPLQELPKEYNDLLRHLMHDHNFPYSRTKGDLRLIHRSQHRSFYPKHRHGKPEKLDDSNKIARRQTRLEKKQRRLDELNAELEKLDDFHKIARRRARLEKKQRRLDELNIAHRQARIAHRQARIAHRQARLEKINAELEKLDDFHKIARRRARIAHRQAGLEKINAELENLDDSNEIALRQARLEKKHWTKKRTLTADLPLQELPEEYNDLVMHLMHDHNAPYSSFKGDLRPAHISLLELFHRSQHTLPSNHRHAELEKEEDGVFGGTSISSRRPGERKPFGT